MSLRSRLIATGIHRLGGPRNGFRYRRADRRPVAAADSRRIADLRIPSAWIDVHISASPRARLQAVGRDAAGRWQYLYLAAHSARRARSHFDRLLAFGETLPSLRRALARDLALPGLPRAKALACAVAVLATCLLRSGSEAYVANGAFGLATLRDRHVTVNGDTIRLDFRGKYGKRQRHDLRDARLARIVAAMQRLPGVEVFKFVDAQGRVRDLRRKHINDYIRAAMGARFSARMFRTWGATLSCARAWILPSKLTPSARRAATVAALRATAAQLGNTLAVCRRAYIHPAVLRAFAEGRSLMPTSSPAERSIAYCRSGLDVGERALLALLRRDRA